MKNLSLDDETRPQNKLSMFANQLLRIYE